MTTGKKVAAATKPKRKPKPTRGAEIDLFFELVFPLLTAGTDQKTIIKAASPLVGKYLVPPGRYGPTPEGKFLDPSEQAAATMKGFRALPKVVNHIQETIDIARKMILTATSDKTIYPLSLTVREALGIVGLTAVWSCRGSAWIGPSFIASPQGTLKEKAWPPRIRALVFYIIGRAIMTGGEAWFGVCPRCGKVFEKARTNAEYCGRSCAVMDSRDRERRLNDY